MVDEPTASDAPDDRPPREMQDTDIGRSAGDSGSSPTYEEENRGPAMASGFLLALVLAFLIGWIPLVGPFAAGLAGGWFTRSRNRGLYAAFVPGVLSMFWFWAVVYLYDVPFLSGVAQALVPAELIFSGASAMVFSFIFMAQFLVCIIGGWVGGDLREHRDGRADDQWPRPV